MKTSTLLKPLVGVAFATGLLLLIPLVAMQFTNEVVWTLGDFIVAAGLLFLAGSAMVVGVTRVKRPTYRVVMVATITLGLALVWAQLAVGLFK